MKTHFLIWLIRSEATTGSFFRSLKRDTAQRWVVFKTDTLPERYIIDNDHIKILCQPDAPTDESQWENVLREGYEWVITKAALGTGVGEIAVDILMDESVRPDTHEILYTLQKALKRITGLKYVIHLVWLCQALSDNSEAEIKLLEDLKNDPVSKERTINDCNQQEEKELSELEQQQRTEKQNLSVTAEPDNVNRIDTKYAGLKLNLKEKYEKKRTEGNWLEWNRLTVLSDNTSTGSELPIILEYRNDILYQITADPSFMTNSEESYRALGYHVHVCPYSRNDVAKVPEYMLWKYIREHDEDLAEIQRRITPDFEQWYSELNENIRQQYEDSLGEALLVDDNNYEDRNAQQLIEKFAAYNRLPGIADDTLAAAKMEEWLNNTKRELAKWIDVDPDIRDFICPSGKLAQAIKGTLSEKKDQVQAVKEKLYRGRFGKNEKLTRREDSANALATNLMDYMALNSVVRAFEIARDRLPELTQFIAGMDDANRTIFDEVDKAQIHDVLLTAMSSTKWFADVKKARDAFQLSNLKPDDIAVKDYGKWLQGVLEQDYYSRISEQNKAEAMEQYAQLASDDAARDSEGFAMISAGFQSISEHDEHSCIGTSTRLYLLGRREWEIDKCDPKQVFAIRVGERTLNLVESKAHKVTHTDTVDIENKSPLLVSPEVEFDQEYIILRWRWKSNAVIMNWRIMQDEHCLMEDIEENYDNLGEIEIKKPLASFPEGELILQISCENSSCDCPFTVEYPRQTLRMEVNRSIFGRKTCMVSGLKKVMNGIPYDKYALSLKLRNKIYNYPIRDLSMELILKNETVRPEAVLTNKAGER